MRGREMGAGPLCVLEEGTSVTRILRPPRPTPVEISVGIVRRSAAKVPLTDLENPSCQGRRDRQEVELDRLELLERLAACLAVAQRAAGRRAEDVLEGR